MIEELRAKAEALGIRVDGRWKESKLLQVIADAAENAPVITEAYDEPADELVGDSERISAMNAYALRIWEGQSTDNLRQWRIERVKAGLTAQGWDDILEHLSLPNA